MKDREIRALHYASGKSETVGIVGVSRIRLAYEAEDIVGVDRVVTTYIVERFGKLWKQVPAWMVTVELEE